jgi:hypothetical protein
VAISFWLILFVIFLSRWRFYKFSLEATKVFSAFGFPYPAKLNLPKRHARADKEYCKETGEPRSWGEPWRYRHEATLAEKKAQDVKVIHPVEDHSRADAVAAAVDDEIRGRQLRGELACHRKVRISSPQRFGNSTRRLKPRG